MSCISCFANVPPVYVSSEEVNLTLAQGDLILLNLLPKSSKALGTYALHILNFLLIAEGLPNLSYTN
jgi:hypothetical protein